MRRPSHQERRALLVPLTACRLFLFTVLAHAAAVCITPLVREAAALLKGLGAFPADGIAASLGARVDNFTLDLNMVVSPVMT